MKVALVYPPACDPTAPYLSLPTLAAQLRGQGVDVHLVDANVEAFDWLLSRAELHERARRVEQRFAELSARASLAHAEALEYGALARALPLLEVPERIDDAKRVLRATDSFFDPLVYDEATQVIDGGLALASAAHAPLRMDFTTYRTPFSMLTMRDVEADSARERNPFFDWVEGVLGPRLREARVNLVGLSVCFPGQLQPAYAFAHQLRRLLPGVHLTVGGPGATQMMIRLEGQSLARALGPFDSAVLYEGEIPLTRLCETLDAGTSLRDVPNLVVRDKLLGARFTPAHGMQDLRALAAPSFDGLPLDRYLAPKLVLPYDPTRGCYWGKCTFCHYGLAEVGTATYRERRVEAVVEHLASLSEKHETDVFYFSQDSVAPKTLLKLADRIVSQGLRIRWATDLKPEKYLTPERAVRLRESGAIACALGVESASPRVLELIDKGAPIEVVTDVVERLSDAGIAAEAMCFTDFPTETAEEALETLAFLRHQRQSLGLFIVGEFGLTHGALVAQRPSDFGIDEVWQLEGDELGLGLFHSMKQPSKSELDRERIDAELDTLSSRWLLRRYPWAGAVSTAHTLLHYVEYGPSAFRVLARKRAPEPEPVATGTLAFDPADLEGSERIESGIWREMAFDRRTVSRTLYEELAARVPPLLARPAINTLEGTPRSEQAPRRPDTSANAVSSRSARARSGHHDPP
jgi:anaerobic magnesium-protoporphyrin IX monomethyl ester cyclase